MNREETKREVERLEKILPVMKAFAEGRQIACDGQPKENPRWDAQPYRYSIVEPPQYVPFKWAEEFLEALEKQKFPAIVDGDNVYFIATVDTGDATVYFGEAWKDLNDLLREKFTFYDGTPCGKLKQ